MQPLKKMIGDARIVSLGEATHGSREIFQLKHRMMEFLATEMGFSIFSIEASMPEAYRLNDYVLNGKGDPAKLIKGMYFWTWDTQEVLDMVLWMREFNKSGKRRVEFTGFDMQYPVVASGIVRDFVEKADSEYGATFAKAYGTAQAASRAQSGAFGVATATFPLKEAAGKRVRFSGYIKTEQVTRGFAGLWWRVDGKEQGRSLAFDNMQDRGVKGTTDWERYAIELEVPEDATNINFGALFPGQGTAWFDHFAVELDGKEYVTDGLDFDFEGATPKGFYTGGNGYRVELDKEVFQSGKQSLRMKYMGPPPDDSIAPKQVSAMWKDVVGHLEANRDGYRAKEIPASEIEWAVQNARVTLQCFQSRGNEVSRDHSMADNVKWIADQSPQAKIVLWAHNGHVNTVPAMGKYGPMGGRLRTVFGDRMVVFGFAFNQGGFQAISQEKKMLKDFSVPPAPAGSLDATLAAAGIPILALDLRQAPHTGPVADWLGEAHKTRSIGAIYPEDQPFAFLFPQKAQGAFDVILFLDKVTPARKN
jgi:erythromycin esterase-like protein